MEGIENEVKIVVESLFLHVCVVYGSTGIQADQRIAYLRKQTSKTSLTDTIVGRLEE